LIEDTDARNRRFAGICLSAALLLTLLMTSCRKAAPGASSQAQARTVLPQQPSDSDSGDLPSCRAFVQGFYDRYWNHMADKAAAPDFDPRNLPTVEQLLKQEPAVLSPELAGLLAHEEREMARRHEVGNLDFDPFLNSQDPQGRYVVGSVKMDGDRCMAKIDKADMVAELKKSGTSWAFTNFHYSYYAEDRKTKTFPDNDLVHLLQTSRF